MTKVKLRGLNIRRSKGKWYVSIRRSGESLIKGFDGSRKELDKHLASSKFLMEYSARKTKGTMFPDGTLGNLIDWYKAETNRWSDLKPRTKADYDECFAWLTNEQQYPLEMIDRAGIANLRNKASKKRWPRFADHLVTALSAVFDEAVDVGKIKFNPCVGVRRLYKPNKQANREWTPEEQEIVFSSAPAQALLIMVIAREAGVRGIDIWNLKWNNYKNGTLRFIAEKNGEEVIIPCSDYLRNTLDATPRVSVFISTNKFGVPWKNHKVLQNAVRRHIRNLADEAFIKPGLTLHGLRVTLAAEFKRLDIDDRTIANILGDTSESMGRHYTRHVPATVNVISAFDLRRKSCAK
ncbi:MAG: tyrosine-type recombinase/integrase [Planctomycetaceae bacterium]|nr:tyrosine-type recombinase/integrase [Planctomycetaceae bacterium]